jgi:DNA invertase Pin-like site-specific DNA recombinase
MKIALYLRVSTGEQSVEPQRLELREYCARRGWTEIREFTDTISGAKWTRFGLNALLAEVRRGKVDVVLCVKLDRLGRSLPQLAQMVGEFETHRTALVCTSQGIDTTDGNPAGKLQMHVLMAVAEFERSLIRERTKAGLANAVANGKTLGRRPKVQTPEQTAELDEWMISAERCSYDALAVRLGVPKTTAFRWAKERLGD